MIPYTRITLVADRSRAELVLPSTEPVGTQMPTLLSLLGGQSGYSGTPAATRLVRADGRLVDLELDLAAQEVLDGEVLRLVADDEIPPPARVSDLSEAMADLTETHPGRWRRTDRPLGAGILIGVLAALAARPQRQLLSPTAHTWVALAVILALFAVAALRRSGIGPTGVDVLGRCLLLGLLAAQCLALATGGTAYGALAALALILLATAAMGLAFDRLGWSAGAAVGLGVEGVWMLIAALSPTSKLAYGFLAVLALILAGSLPWIALVVSGAARLDDTALTGVLPPRDRARRSLTAAHDSLLVSCLVAAAALAWATASLARQGDPWGRWLAVTVVVATALRSRAFPLRAEVISLWLACLPAPLILASTLPSPQRAVLLAVIVLVLAAAALYQSADQTRVRLRRLGDMVETAATIATVPLLCGLDGLFTHLLGLFA
ncbi:EsaB/YukD family protein [Actinomyces sp. MRS3W]|uniref:EsaB/YukD family protein n=1 Tax=Actinomyces sp. MRS3W TaxID=2800796 RepID=UPI0028FD4FDC|nr:EsaB/YukD family protein [Actinomyces sp. MRS3W]MDU0348072.1 EsaB/YukD family protein [Actinomyces sp. MRS3W]